MSSVLFALLIISMVATLAVMIVGMVAMTKGGAFNEKYGNKLMRLRVILQGVSLALFALVLLNSAG